MHAGVVGEFGMEGGRHRCSLPDGNGSLPSVAITSTPGPTCSILGARMKTISIGIHSPDFPQEFALTDGAVDLASVGVPADADVERAESGLPRILYFGRRAESRRRRCRKWA